MQHFDWLIKCKTLFLLSNDAFLHHLSNDAWPQLQCSTVTHPYKEGPSICGWCMFPTFPALAVQQEGVVCDVYQFLTEKKASSFQKKIKNKFKHSV